MPFEVVHLLRDKPAVAHRRASLAVSPRVRVRVELEPLCVDDCMVSRPVSIARGTETMVCDLAKINGAAEATPISIRLVSPRAALSNMLLSSESDVAWSEMVRIHSADRHY